MQNVASNVLTEAIAGFWRQMSGSFVGCFDKSSLILIKVCGQLNNFSTISFTGNLRIDYYGEFGARTQSAMCRRPRFMVNFKTHFSSDYQKYL